MAFGQITKILHGFENTPVQLWPLLERTYISPVLVGTNMKKILKNTQESRSREGGQIVHQAALEQNDEKKKLMWILSFPRDERISGNGRKGSIGTWPGNNKAASFGHLGEAD